MLGLGSWYIDLPFEDIPEDFIRQITENYYPTTSIEKWNKMLPWLNSMPTIWNSCLVEDGKRIVAFVYGDWDPLLSHMQIIRFSIRPELFRVSGELYKDYLSAARVHAKVLGVRRIYFITCRWEAFLRKAPSEFELAKAKVLEVKNV